MGLTQYKLVAHETRTQPWLYHIDIWWESIIITLMMPSTYMHTFQSPPRRLLSFIFESIDFPASHCLHLMSTIIEWWSWSTHWENFQKAGEAALGNSAAFIDTRAASKLPQRPRAYLCYARKSHSTAGHTLLRLGILPGNLSHLFDIHDEWCPSRLMTS